MLEKVAENGGLLTSPYFDKEGVLHVCDSQTGAVYKVVDGKFVEHMNTQGQPTGLAFDPNMDTMYICDPAHQAILRLETDQSDNAPILAEYVNEYEGRPLKGPSAMAFDAEGNMFFCDSGPLGETTLTNPKASVFTIANDASLLQPLAFESLAMPSGLCLSPNDKILYVAETLQNRILRFVQRPAGVWHASVYHTFSGGFGPVACCMDGMGVLYVARHDFRHVANVGVISILLPNGHLHAELTIPGAEVTGVCFDRDQQYLYITEASAGVVYRYKITPSEEVEAEAEVVF